MRRREFLAYLGGAGVAWPLSVSAQQPSLPVVGFLNGGSSEVFAPFAAAFRQGLSAAGFIDGQNVSIEYRWAAGRINQVPALTGELVARNPAVLVMTGPRSSINPASATNIPVVATFASDPVNDGVVSSLARPGGNLTGATLFNAEMEAKRLEMLHEIVRNNAPFGVLLAQSSSLTARLQAREIEAVARALGREIHILNFGPDDDLERAFAALMDMRAGAVVITASAVFTSKRVQLAEIAARHALPAIAELREFAAAGGLMSYGPSVREVYRQIGVYAGRILKGEKPADLPVIQPSKFELAINLKTAKALGVEIPPIVLAQADEIID